jgi:hypothetical protein
MAEITVCIEIDEDGTISVGAEPSESEDSSDDGSDPSQAQGMTDLSQPPEAGEEDAEKSYMKPVNSIEQALSVARDLLKNANQVSGATMGGDPGGPGAQDAANAAFQARRGGR